MATAKQVDGKSIVAYKDGKAVDSEGVVIPGAPKQPKDTDPSKQPGALGAPTPEERMGIAIADALSGKVKRPAAAAASDDVEGDEETGLPTLADLPDHLATLTTVKDVKALQKTDERVGAVKHYEARIAEIEAE